MILYPISRTGDEYSINREIDLQQPYPFYYWTSALAICSIGKSNITIAIGE